MMTPDEATAAHAKLTAIATHIADALRPDADGKVRLTKAEASALLREFFGAALAIVVDLVD